MRIDVLPDPSPRRVALLALGAAVLAGACTSAAGPSPTQAAPGPFAPPRPSAPVPIDPTWQPPVRGGSGPPLEDRVAVVQAVRPSVVSIDVQHVTYLSLADRVHHVDAGSGWILDANGLIVTNNHVVAGAQEVTVTLDDGRVFTARRIAGDPGTDLAVVKIDATGLPAARLGRSSDLDVGTPIVVLGNAMGWGIGMAGGWVSRLGTSVTEPGGETLYDLIELDAAVNPGNSGGPLADMAGEVVGITNAKLVASAVEEIGYAISIDWALPTIEQLVRTGRVVRPFVGLTFHTVNAGLAERFSLSVDAGALVTEVAPGSPAETAGLHAGNVITAIDGEAVSSSTQAARAIEQGVVGRAMTLDYWQGTYHGTATVVPVSR